MRDILRPGQKVLAARWEGEDLKDSVIYGLRGPLGFSVKRLRFDRDGEPVYGCGPTTTSTRTTGTTSPETNLKMSMK